MLTMWAVQGSSSPGGRRSTGQVARGLLEGIGHGWISWMKVRFVDRKKPPDGAARGSRYRWISEFQSSSLVRRWVAVNTGCAVFCGDVAEAAFVFARHPCGWLVGGEPADQSSEVLDELRVQTAHRYSCCPRRIDDFSCQLGVLVLRQCSGQGVYVDHDLYEVRRLFPSSFDVDDEGVIAPHYDQVGPASQRG